MNTETDIDNNEERLNHVLDTMDNLENLADEEFANFLSDEESMSCTRALIECGKAKLYKEASAPDVEKEWERFRNVHISLPQSKRRMKRIAWFAALTGAAAVIAVLVMFNYSWNRAVPEETNKSIIAFSANHNPREILFNDEEDIPISEQKILAKDRNLVITDKMADFTNAASDGVATRSITTPRGKEYKIILSDGTTVMMNADSKLIFPTRFSGKERTVKLVGEAYFKVAKDCEHPFIVYTDKVKTRVLGTEFNLRAYPSSEINVTLIEGSVVVNDNQTNHEIELKPGQNATLRDNHDFDITTVDTDYYIQWKEGYFYFDNLPLVEVMKELGRWYNVDVEITSNSLMSYRLHFIAERNASIDQVIENLNNFSYLSVRKEGNKIIISKKI